MNVGTRCEKLRKSLLDEGRNFSAVEAVPVEYSEEVRVLMVREVYVGEVTVLIRL